MRETENASVGAPSTTTELTTIVCSNERMCNGARTHRLCPFSHPQTVLLFVELFVLQFAASKLFGAVIEKKKEL